MIFAPADRDVDFCSRLEAERQLRLLADLEETLGLEVIAIDFKAERQLRPPLYHRGVGE